MPVEAAGGCGERPAGLVEGGERHGEVFEGVFGGSLVADRVDDADERVREGAGGVDAASSTGLLAFHALGFVLRAHCWSSPLVVSVMWNSSLCRPLGAMVGLIR
jgi:hypothetical protein